MNDQHIIEEAVDQLKACSQGLLLGMQGKTVDIKDALLYPEFSDELKLIVTSSLKRQREEIIHGLKVSSLGHLLSYFEHNRGVGHTRAAVEGVDQAFNSLLVVADEKQKLSVDLPKENQLTIRQVTDEKFMRSRRHALVVDHYALRVMFDQLIHELEK